MNKTKNDHYTYLQLNFTRVININKLLKLNFCFIISKKNYNNFIHSTGVLGFWGFR
jgi:hypothetical protein